MTRVGFIGLGAMGAPMAANLLRAGFPLIVHNRTREKEEALAEAGADRAGSPSEAAAAADIIITIVSDVPDVKEVILGPDGVLEGAAAGSLVIDMSTIGPIAAREVAESCRQSRVRFMDAPVSGGVWGAEKGTLSIMAGGEERDFREAMPLFEVMGGAISLLGPVGAGQATKLVNQVIGAGTLAAVAEGLMLAGELGVDPQGALGAVSKGAAASWALENLGPRMLQEDFDTGFKVNLHAKDLKLVLAAADQAGTPVVVTRMVLQFFAAAQAAGHGEQGTQSIIRAFQQLAANG